MSSTRPDPKIFRCRGRTAVLPYNYTITRERTGPGGPYNGPYEISAAFGEDAENDC